MNKSVNDQHQSVRLSLQVGALLLGLLPTSVFASLSGGDQHSLANTISIIRGYFGWGSNQDGQLGNQFAEQSRYYPIWTPYQPWWLQSATAPTAMPLAAEDTPVQVASGHRHSVALQDDGTVWTWGKNEYGQLGDGTTTNRNEPVQVSGLSNVIAVAAGKYHSLAVTREGQVWAWGRNDNRQLGNNSSDDALKPVLVVVSDGGDVSPLPGVMAVAASEVHSVALKSDGTVWAWGDNRYGQLGTGNTLGSGTAKRTPGLAEVRVISAGGDLTTARTLARTGDNALWGWGNNTKCQMGESPREQQTTPVRLTELSRLGEVRALASGLAHGVALTADGQVWTWGDNQHGQLGDGTSTSRCTPMPVSGVSQVQAIGAGDQHTLVTQSDGTVRAWGKNEYGQLP